MTVLFVLAYATLTRTGFPVSSADATLGTFSPESPELNLVMVLQRRPQAVIFYSIRLVRADCG
ncbi:MAG: hypothetical protein RLP02_08550 [Coleofasciculus sp. C2-GNP5-27]